MPLHAVREFLLSEGCLNMPSGKLKLLKTHLEMGSTPTTHPIFPFRASHLRKSMSNACPIRQLEP